MLGKIQPMEDLSNGSKKTTDVPFAKKVLLTHVAKMFLMVTIANQMLTKLRQELLQSMEVVKNTGLCQALMRQQCPVRLVCTLISKSLRMAFPMVV